MKTGDLVSVLWTNAQHSVMLKLDERVLSDLSAGQWTSGWVAFHEYSGDEFFIEDSGDVYRIGTSTVMGICPKLAAWAKEREAEEEEHDENLLMGGM